MASKYNATFFLKKFVGIPDQQWTTGMFSRKGKHCALGQLGAPTANYVEVMALVRLFKKYLDTKPTQVNDGDDVRFQQKTPKRRMIAALQQIKENRK